MSSKKVLEESVSRTPRIRVDGERWLGVHLSALETIAIVSAWPDELGKVGRAVKVVLHACEAARVRVVLDVGRGSDAAKS